MIVKKLMLILLCLLFTIPVVCALDITNMMTVVNQYIGKPDWIRSTNQSSESFIFGNITLTGVIAGDIDMGGYSIYNANWFNSTNVNTTNLYADNINPDGSNLTIEDTMFIDNSNTRVGIGTTTPAKNLEISQTAKGTALRISSLFNGGWASNEELGSLEFYSGDVSGPNPTVGAKISAIETGTGFGATWGLGFYTHPSAGAEGSPPTLQMVIDDEGNVGIGTATPTSKLHIAIGNTNHSGGNISNIVNIIGNSARVIIGDTGAASGHSLTADDDLHILGKAEIDGLSYFDSVAQFDVGIDLDDDDYIYFGTGDDAQIEWETAQTNDALFVGLSGSNNIIIGEKGDIAYDFAYPISTNPTVYIPSATQSTTEWGSLSHDTEEFTIDSGTNETEIVTRLEVNDDFYAEADLIQGDELSQLKLFEREINGTHIIFDSPQGYPFYFKTGNVTVEQELLVNTINFVDGAKIASAPNYLYFYSADGTNIFNIRTASNKDTQFLQPVNFLDNVILSLGTGVDTQIYYNASDLIIDPDAVGTGDVVIRGGLNMEGNNISNVVNIIGNSDNVIIGDAGVDSHSLSADDDLFVSGKGEFDGPVYFDAGAAVYSQLDLSTNVVIRGSNGINELNFQPTTQAAGASAIWGLTTTPYQLIITAEVNDGNDHDHSAQINPTVYIQSATDPDTRNEEWGSLSHDTANFELDSGTNMTEIVTQAEINDDAYFGADAIVGDPISDLTLFELSSNGTHIVLETFESLPLFIKTYTLNGTATQCYVNNSHNYICEAR